ncbi:hypothetical protein [Mesorhizobium sp. BR-1-1-10]|uniref:hypothetical protein n=1 Tax=Mesorhizobium sp. BR-1-1-10 TaxID=2876660 RepID=UPI001CD13E22|nr:hypothetical protein [Mesorhizobium sp. BR-1-1-10]MBZ9974035.1 hypothetical protein [Mesorhizobium sp. BR-1-1-10]
MLSAGVLRLDNTITGQFTIEGFFRFNAAPTNCLLIAQWVTGGWAFWFDGGQLYFRDGSSVDSGKYTWSPTLNTWSMSMA